MPPRSLKPTLRGFSAHKPPFQPIWFAPSEQTTGGSRHPAQMLPPLPASLTSFYAILAFWNMHFLLLLVPPRHLLLPLNNLCNMGIETPFLKG